jgi:hypothetical protein
MNELITLESTELQGIELSKAKQIKAVFDPMTEMLMKFEDDFNTIIEESKVEITKEITAKAKRLRIDIGRVRIATEKTRKEQKEEYLRAGKAIDSVANIVKWVVTDKEEKLEKIEKHYEFLEQQRIEKLQTERAEELQQYVDAVPSDLGTMKDDVWQAYIDTKKRQYEERIEAEKKAEVERLENERIEKLRWERSDAIRPFYNFFDGNGIDNLGKMSQEEFDGLMYNLSAKKEEYDAEQERIRFENERLKKEAEEKRKADEIERKKREEEDRKRCEKEAAERKAAEEKARKEREAYEAKLKKERDEREKIERAERAKREAVERELAERKAVEERKAAEEKARIQAELNKGDSDKVKDLITDLESLKTKYQFKSEKNRKMYSDVSGLIDKVIVFINK